jgi:hypothetical protein
MRRKGSARFDPYYKLDRYDPVSLCWRPVGKAYPTLDDVRRAVRALDDENRYRALHVTIHGKTPIAL